MQANFDLNGRLVGGLEEIPPRWKRGVRWTNALIGEAVGKLYVERHFPPEAKARMESLVDNLMTAFGEAIDGLEWMSDETKAKAQTKRASMAYLIGYPDKWKEYDFEISDKTYATNVLSSNAWELKRILAKMGKPYEAKSR